MCDVSSTAVFLENLLNAFLVLFPDLLLLLLLLFYYILSVIPCSVTPDILPPASTYVAEVSRDIKRLKPSKYVDIDGIPS
jgi:hypothetical protein